jgi:parallel beta-helix repeat protein
LVDDNIVSNNTVGYNSLYGILLDTSRNTTISYNTIFKTNSGGISLWGAEHNTIAQNVVFNNVKEGIMIDESSKDNFMRFNDFLGNNVGKSQASDNGTNNIFKNNYWSDWTGTGMYPIDGTKGNQDSSPLPNPYHLSAPVITAPTSTTLKDKVTIQWTISSDSFGHSITYTVYYSKDDGKSWIALASGLTVLTYTWDVTSLYHGIKVLLKIQSTDNIGFSSSSVLDTSFSIDNPGLISTSPTTPPLTTPPPTTSKSTTTEPTSSTGKSKTTTSITPGFTTLLLLATLSPLLLRKKLRQREKD